MFNPVQYVSSVEYGHRARDDKEWVDGRFMMAISVKEIE